MKIFEVDERHTLAYNSWVESRPPAVQDLIRRFPPTELYRLKSTGHRVEILAYSEDGTVRVLVSGRWNAVVINREVFGIAPEDLEPCDAPGPEEVLGTLYEDEASVSAFIEARRREGC